MSAWDEIDQEVSYAPSYTPPPSNRLPNRRRGRYRNQYYENESYQRRARVYRSRRPREGLSHSYSEPYHPRSFDRPRHERRFRNERQSGYYQNNYYDDIDSYRPRHPRRRPRGFHYNEEYQTERNYNEYDRHYTQRRPRRFRQSKYRKVEHMSAPIFRKIESLEPEEAGINIKCKIMGQPILVTPEKAVFEVKVGDQSGCISAWLVNPEEGILIPGQSLVLRNGKIVMKEDKFMRLQVNEFGKIEKTEDLGFEGNENNDLSAVEYEVG